MNVDRFIDEALEIVPRSEYELRQGLEAHRSSGVSAMQSLASMLSEYIPNPQKVTGWKKKLWKLWLEHNPG